MCVELLLRDGVGGESFVEQMPYAALAKQMRLSPFEVHAAVQRLIAARLVTKHTGSIRPSMAALRTFLINGAPYAYPPVRGQTTIGFPTSHAVPPLSERIQPSADLPPVWPHPEGTARGQGVLPLYEKLPLAAMDDPKLYEFLALFDALRIGQARERELPKCSWRRGCNDRSCGQSQSCDPRDYG